MDDKNNKTRAIFKNDLTPEQQAKQDAAAAKELAGKRRLAETVIEVAVDVAEAIIDIIVN